MKRTLYLIFCLLLVLSGILSLSACRDPYLQPGSGETTYKGVNLRVTGIDYSGEYIKLNTVWQNTTIREVTYGAYYVIERYDDGEWINCMRSDIDFIEIAYVLSPLGNREMTYSLEYADISKEGTYRVRSDCYVHNNDEIISCSLYSTFTIDNKFTLAGYHKLDYELRSFLYEDLKPYYKEGETVIVKIGKVYDLGFDLYLDGEELVMESWDGDYWQYSFVMPNHPVRLTCRTYDGFVPAHDSSSDPVKYPGE